MSDSDGSTFGLAAAADHLERWVDALPHWTEAGEEPWYVFLNRRYEAEMALIERLRLSPKCRIVACPMRQHIDLNLAGIFVSTNKGLAAACREWASKARARVES